MLSIFKTKKKAPKYVVYADRKATDKEIWARAKTIKHSKRRR